VPGISRSVAYRTRADAGKLRVFISCSRDDIDFADRLAVGLELTGFDPAIDRKAISDRVRQSRAHRPGSALRWSILVSLALDAACLHRNGETRFSPTRPRVVLCDVQDTL
jgi:hypothetical protein